MKAKLFTALAAAFMLLFTANAGEYVLLKPEEYFNASDFETEKLENTLKKLEAEGVDMIKLYLSASEHVTRKDRPEKCIGCGKTEMISLYDIGQTVICIPCYARVMDEADYE
jgi:hypothetical protein